MLFKAIKRLVSPSHAMSNDQDLSPRTC